MNYERCQCHVGRKLKDRCHKEGSISMPWLWFPPEIHSYVVGLPSLLSEPPSIEDLSAHGNHCVL